MLTTCVEMAQRKDVFQSKVLQRLYPKAPTEENKPNPMNVVETLANKPALKRKAFQNSVKDDGEPLSSTTDPGLRVYTALPPPADYQAAIQGASITHPQPGSINSGGEAAAESSEDTDQDGPCGEHRKRRRRRGKRRRVLHEHSSMDGETGASELSALHPTQDSSVSAVGGAGGDAGGDGVGGGEHLSKNRRRKLKKKRHKEKQRSLGLVPRTSALEFTYQKEADEEEEEEEEEYGEEEEEEEGKRADEVSQFLRSTMKIYLSDGSVHPELPTAAVQKLLSSIVDGGAPPSVLKRLTHLMGLVRRKEAGRLARALEDLHHGTSPLPPEDTAAMVPLFRYWITDILPMQRDAKE